MADLGLEVTNNEVDFNSALIPSLLGQNFDMIALAWSLGLPIDPDVTAFYTPERDVVDSGFNFVSYYNEDMNDLLEQARFGVEDCNDLDARRGLYEEVQQILFDDLPYLYLYVNNSMVAAQGNVRELQPGHLQP